MNDQIKIPDPETRARTLADLKEVNRQWDLTILMLDEAIAVADAHLLEQRRTRLMHKSNHIPADSIES
jgi:hypothetical protein